MEDSSTTKLRVFFDGSTASSSGYSLNDVLMAGPVFQPKLFQILLRFRSHPVVIRPDICKIYRCARAQLEDSHLQCILCRAVRAMHQSSADEHTAFPLGAEVIRHDFCVDNLIS